MSKVRVLFPGTFDPPTNGHSDIVDRCLNIFDCVVVAVLSNSAKTTLFTVKERLELLKLEYKQYGKKVEVLSFSGLLVDFAKRQKINIVVRGLRAISDFDYEAQMALMNKSLWPDVETLFLTAKEENSYVSSTLVKQVSSLGGSVRKLVSANVVKALQSKFHKRPI